MCKGRLAQDASIREAVDPVSGKPVDKAKAVIGAKPDGKVLYFESEKTFSQYQKRKTS
jgi:YHS domain-containing protein